MNLNPFNTYTYNHYEYKRHMGRADKFHEKALLEEKKALDHAAWIVQEQENAQRMMNELNDETTQLQELIQKLESGLEAGTKAKVKAKRQHRGRPAKVGEDSTPVTA